MPDSKLHLSRDPTAVLRIPLMLQILKSNSLGNTSATKRNPCWTQTTLQVSNNCDHRCHRHLHQRYQVSIHQFNLDVVIISLNKILSSDISWSPSRSDLDAQTLHHWGDHYNMQDLGILEVDLRVLELDLRFRGGLGSSPIGLENFRVGLEI